jgi:predicted Zn-dependent protease
VIMRRAGYNPQAFDDMLKLMETKVKSGGPGFGKTHPEPKDRADAVEKALAGKPQVVTPSAAASARQARYQAALGTI